MDIPLFSWMNNEPKQHNGRNDETGDCPLLDKVACSQHRQEHDRERHTQLHLDDKATGTVNVNKVVRNRNYTHVNNGEQPRAHQRPTQSSRPSPPVTTTISSGNDVRSASDMYTVSCVQKAIMQNICSTSRIRFGIENCDNYYKVYVDNIRERVTHAHMTSVLNLNTEVFGWRAIRSVYCELDARRFVAEVSKEVVRDYQADIPLINAPVCSRCHSKRPGVDGVRSAPTHTSSALNSQDSDDRLKHTHRHYKRMRSGKPKGLCEHDDDEVRQRQSVKNRDDMANRAKRSRTSADV